MSIFPKTIFYLKISKIDLRRSIPLILSISICLALFLSIVITVDSTSTELFEETKNDLRKISVPHFTIGKQYNFDFSMAPFSDADELISQFNDIFISNHFEQHVETVYKEYDIPINANYTALNSTNSYSGLIAFFTKSNNQSILQQMVNQSRLPLNSNESIIIIKEPLKSIFQLNSTINFTLDFFNYKSSSNIPLKIVGIFVLKSEDVFLNSIEYHMYLDSIRSLVGYGQDSDYPFTVLMNQNNYGDILTRIAESSQKVNNDIRTRLEIQINYRINTSFLEESKALDYINKINRISDIISQFEDITFIQNEINSFMYSYTRNWIGNLVFLFIITSPVSVVSILLVRFAKDATFSIKKHNYNYFKLRSYLKRDLFSYLLIDSTLIFIFSTLIGAITGIVVSSFILQHILRNPSFNLSFTKWIFVYLLISLMISIYSQKMAIFKLLSDKKDQMSKTISDDLKSSELKGLKFLIFGIMLFIVSIVLDNPDVKVILGLGEYFISMVNFYIKGFSVIFSVISIILLLRGIYIWIIRKISLKIWPLKGNKTIVIGLMNILRFKTRISRIWLILSVLFIFSILSLSVITSVEQSVEQHAKYYNLSDYKLRYTNQNEEGLLDFFNQKNISGKVHITKMKIVLIYYLQDGFVSTLYLIGIDPNTITDEMIGTKKHGFNSSFSDFINQMKTNNNTAAVHNSFLNENNLVLNESFFDVKIYVKNDSIPDYPYSSVTIGNFSIDNSFTNFPSIIENREISYTTMFVHINYISYYKSIPYKEIFGSKGFIYNYMFINTQTSLSEIDLDLIRNNYGAEIHSIEDSLQQIKRNIKFDSFHKTLLLCIFLTFIVTCGTFITYGSFEALSRSKDYAIEGILGLTQKEKIKIILFENSIIVGCIPLISSLLSIIISIIFIVNIFPSVFPTLELGITLNLPLLEMLLYVFSYLFISILSIIPTIFIQNRCSTVNLLKRIDIES